MVGIPKVYNTKQDYENAVAYAVKTNSGKAEVARALHDLKDVPAEEQTADDYKKVENPNCKKNQLGFTDEEIDALLAKVE